MFRLGVITDEIDPELEQALAVALDLGVRDVELNSLWGRSMVQLAESEVSRALRLVCEHGLRVSCLSTPALKAVLLEEGGLCDAAEEREHLRMVERGCELARAFQAPLVRIFSFRRSGIEGLGNPSPRLARGGPLPDAVLSRVAERLHSAADMARAAGVTLVVENVRSCWGNSCWNAARIVAAADHPHLKLVWDPGNDYVSGGAPFPEGYEAARPWMAHAHLKNAALVNHAGLTRWERIGRGDLDFRAMLRRLADDRYPGAVMLETHWRGEGLTAEQSTRASFADLLQILPDSPSA
jgi:sugar phosphate isomerase/epimerase